MELVHHVLFGVIVAALLVGWVLGRLGIAGGTVMSFVAGQLLRLAAGVVFAAVALEAAGRGGFWFGAFALLLAVLALASVVLFGVLTWAALKYGLDLDD